MLVSCSAFIPSSSVKSTLDFLWVPRGITITDHIFPCRKDRPMTWQSMLLASLSTGISLGMDTDSMKLMRLLWVFRPVVGTPENRKSLSSELVCWKDESEATSNHVVTLMQASYGEEMTERLIVMTWAQPLENAVTSWIPGFKQYLKPVIHKQLIYIILKTYAMPVCIGFVSCALAWILSNIILLQKMWGFLLNQYKFALGHCFWKKFQCDYVMKWFETNLIYLYERSLAFSLLADLKQR